MLFPKIKNPCRNTPEWTYCWTFVLLFSMSMFLGNSLGGRVVKIEFKTWAKFISDIFISIRVWSIVYWHYWRSCFEILLTFNQYFIFNKTKLTITILLCTLCFSSPVMILTSICCQECLKISYLTENQWLSSEFNMQLRINELHCSPIRPLEGIRFVRFVRLGTNLVERHM